MPTTTIALTCTQRECHRATITLDDQGDPEAGACSCGAEWSELNDPPATEWYAIHLQPASAIAAARATRRTRISDLEAANWRQRMAELRRYDVATHAVGLPPRGAA